MKTLRITHTYSPIVVHATGVHRNGDIFRALETGIPEKKSSFRYDDRMRVFTFHTKQDEASPLLISLERWGVPYTILPYTRGSWENVARISLFLEAVKSATEDYLLFCDSTDCVWIGHPVDCIDRFESCYFDAIFNAETSFFPPAAGLYVQGSDIVMHKGDVGGEFYEAKTPGLKRYLNAGCWMARRTFAEELLSLAEKVVPPLRGDDQGVYHIVYRVFRDRIGLDGLGYIFLCLHDMNSLPNVDLSLIDT